MWLRAGDGKQGISKCWPNTHMVTITGAVIDTTCSEDKAATVADGEGSDFMDAGGASGSGSNGIIGGSSTPQQSLSWRAHKVDSWYEMCDATLQDM